MSKSKQEQREPGHWLVTWGDITIAGEGVTRRPGERGVVVVDTLGRVWMHGASMAVQCSTDLIASFDVRLRLDELRDVLTKPAEVEEPIDDFELPPDETVRLARVTRHEED